MFNFFKRRRKRDVVDENENKNSESAKIEVGVSATESARKSTDEAAKTFFKPQKYDRELYDDAVAKTRIKEEAFKNGAVKDPYTGKNLFKSQTEAKEKYGAKWQENAAESDHITPLETRYKQTKDNPWLTTENVKKSSNSKSNMEVISRKFNNAKRSKSNKVFVEDSQGLKEKGIKLTKDGKNRAIEHEQRAQYAMHQKDFMDSMENLVKTGHNAGIDAAKNSGITGLTIATITNLHDVLTGEKTVEKAMQDTVEVGGKAALTGYVMGGGLTTVAHSLSGSSSKFIQALGKSNIPGAVITTVIATGDTLKRYGNGEISTQTCLLELGEKGLSTATAAYSMTVGQAMIPIPIVGGAIGALVGTVLTHNYYTVLMSDLQKRELEHQERQRLLKEYALAVKKEKEYRAELELYLESYFKEYKDCFDEALSQIQVAYKTGNADEMIAGANKITKKLGGVIQYETLGEYDEFLSSGEKFIL